MNSKKYPDVTCISEEFSIMYYKTIISKHFELSFYAYFDRSTSCKPCVYCLQYSNQITLCLLRNALYTRNELNLDSIFHSLLDMCNISQRPRMDLTKKKQSVYVSDSLAWQCVQLLYCASWHCQHATMLGRPRRKETVGILGGGF